MKTFAFAVFASFAFLACAPAQAELVTYSFEGTVTNRFNNGLPNPSDIFGLNIDVGDSVIGSFSIDTDAPVFGSLIGPIQGEATGYTQSAPQEIRINMGGGVFTSDGDFVSSVANDFQDNVNFPPFEQFTVNDGVASGSQNLTGDTILLNGAPETARISIEFNDNNATAFDSTDLPTSLDLASFSFATGTISGERPSGSFNPFFYQATFRVDSITVSAIPEPSSMALLAAVSGIVMTRRRRSC